MKQPDERGELYRVASFNEDITEHKQAEEAIQQRTAQLGALRQVGLELTAQLDLDTLINSIVSHAVELLGGTSGGLYLYRPGQDVLEWKMKVGPNLAPIGSVLHRGEGLSGKIWETGKPLIVDDYQHWEGQATIYGDYPFAAVVGVPVRWSDDFLGVINVLADRPRTFSPADAELLSLFATQAAIAIRNARLYDEARRRAEQMAVVNRVARAAGAPLNLDGLLETVYQEVSATFQTDAFFIALYDEETDELDFRFRVDEGVRARPDRHPLGDRLVSLVVNDKKPLLIRDVEQEQNHLPSLRLWGTMKIPASWLGVPMQIGERVIGIICVQAYRPNAYGEEEQLLLSTIADQVAVAMENARLFGETQKRVAELEALRRTSLQLTSSLDLSAVLDSIVARALTLMGARDCHIYLYDEATETFTFGATLWEDGRREAAVQAPRSNGLTAAVARGGHPIVINDAPRHPFYTTPEAQKWNMQAITGFPLKRAGRVLGVFTIAFLEPHTFSQEELRVLGLLADQAAIAIENAQLYQQLRDYAGQLEERVQERTAQFQAQYARLEAILRSASDGILVADAEGEIIQTNPVAYTWLTQTLSPEDAARLREEVRNLAQQAAAASAAAETAAAEVTGGERPTTVLELTGLDLELMAAPISHPGIEKGSAVVAVHDVSHLKALDRMKSHFVSNVSHELRTPVTTIKLYAALMQRSPEKWSEYLEPLTQEADQQARLVKDILQISRIDTGRLEMRPRPVSLNELTKETVINHQVLAQERKLNLEHHPAPLACGEVVALVDSVRTMQVLNNLVENAISYTPGGGKVVVSTGKKKAEGRVWATVMVADTGMGIPKEELPHIFERFFRGEEPRLMQISGTGLGLAITKEIVELHGGRVTVESEADVGTTFTVWLPLAEAQE